MSAAPAHPARDRRGDARGRAVGGDRRLPEGDRRRARGDLDDHAQLDRDLGRRRGSSATAARCRTRRTSRADLERRRAPARSCRSSGASRSSRASTSASSSRSPRSSSSGSILNRTTLGYEVRAVGFNPEAAAYGGINVKKNLIRAMAISGAFAGLAGALDMLGYLYHFGQTDIPRQLGRLPRHRRRAARPQHRRRHRARRPPLRRAPLRDDARPHVERDPARARRQPHLHHPGARRALRRRRRPDPLRLELAPEAPRGAERGSRGGRREHRASGSRTRSQRAAARPGRDRLRRDRCSASSRRSSPIPPIQARAIDLADPRRRRRRGRSGSGRSPAAARRLGYGAVAAGMLGIGLGILATRSASGNLNAVFDADADRADVRVRDAAHLRRDRRDVLRAQRRREHRPRGDDADGRLLGRLRRRQGRHLGRRPPRGDGRRRPARAHLRATSRSTCAPTRSSAAPR